MTGVSPEDNENDTSNVIDGPDKTHFQHMHITAIYPRSAQLLLRIALMSAHVASREQQHNNKIKFRIR